MANVFGISFGRKNGNDDVMVKAALMECAAAGHDVRFTNANDLEIKPCTGCVSCVVGMLSGRGKGGCVLKDDFEKIDEDLMWSDGVIVAAPTFETSPSGLFKNVCDRIGCSHDVTFRKGCYERGLAEGKSEDKLPDKRSFKKRTAILMTNGGAMTENWLEFSLPIMYEFTLSMGMDVIDNVKYFGAMEYDNILGNKKYLDRCKRAGKNMVEALASGDDEDRIRWRGDEQGVCPVCHQRLVSVLGDGVNVDCPVCGSHGTLEIVDGQIKVNFTEAERKRSRLNWDGKLEHSTEIANGAMTMKRTENLSELMAPYKSFPKA